ncbi:hypothetical protein DVA86_26520 [Streptomyces armeniacus]|uniref:AMP-dependent synthetase/ligase domain-containing protein n=1 Tax=Streptomyces armeniacus TaxID=83291 RepID=A0A345XVJ8_9ACTN|nr:hypothetical protein [Streptomyces armeniacus]AXK35664.1 hypothetical protein DVA86_26520 [Streptomyces armeniacus]
MRSFDVGISPSAFGELNDTGAGISGSIPELFGARVAAVPDEVAVVCGGASLTYGELGAWSDRLAAVLVFIYTSRIVRSVRCV